MHSIFSQLAELAAQINHLLRSERLVIEKAYAVDDAKALLLPFSFGLLLFLFQNPAVQAKLSTKNNILAHEETLLASALISAVDLLPQITHGGVGIESALELASCDCTDLSRRLGQRGIVPQSHLLQLSKRDARLLGRVLLLRQGRCWRCCHAGHRLILTLRKPKR